MLSWLSLLTNAPCPHGQNGVSLVLGEAGLADSTAWPPESRSVDCTDNFIKGSLEGPIPGGSYRPPGERTGGEIEEGRRACGGR